MKEKIFLIGMMGAGKTSVGKWLSRELNVPFFDTDAMIETQLGMSIAEIFNKWGEVYFRKLEREILQTFRDKTKCVVSTGGGIVLAEENRQFLRSNGRVVFLQAGPETISKRLQGDDTRPLLKELSIETLIEQRKKLYETTAHFNILTDADSISEIGRRILTKL